MFDINKTIKRLLIRLPKLKLYLNNIKLISNNSINTAATTGTTIYYNEEYFSRISKDEQVFILAHEFLHIILKHITRMENKDNEIWNYATDAVINQMLKKIGLPLPEGVIDCPDAKGYSSEEYYEIIKNRDDCEELMSKYRNNEEKISHDSWNDKIDDSDYSFSDITEEEFVEQNKELIKKENDEYIDNIHSKDKTNSTNSTNSNLGNIGESKPLLNWTTYLTKYKRKIISADYNLNNGDFNEEGFYYYPYEVQRGCNVEILLDTSGSVDDDLIRAFLRECKNIFKETKIKIGCFDTKFYGFHEINNTTDIDNFEIEGRGATDFDVAVNSFSNDSNVKIIFTDGYSEEPKKAVDAIWILWTNYKLNPPGGKVVYLDPNTMNISSSKRIR